MAPSNLLATALTSALLAGCLLAGCGTGGRATDPPTEPVSTPAPTPASTSSSEPAAGAGRLGSTDLPEGWREVPWQQRLGAEPGTPAYCGVTVAPKPVHDAEVWYYEMASLPSNVIEYVTSTTEAAAKATMGQLARHRYTCAEPGRTVTPVDLQVGEESVAWDFTGRTSFRVIVFRRGGTLVALGATGVTSVPVDEQLRIARIIDERLSDREPR